MNRLQFLLLKLSEEASEISQIASKTMQFGLHEKHPDLDKNNIQRVGEEIGDLLTIVHLLNKEFHTNLGEYSISDRVAKIKKLDYYYNYSKELGMVK